MNLAVTRHGDLRCAACVAFDAAERAAIQGDELPPHSTLAICTCDEPATAASVIGVDAPGGWEAVHPARARSPERIGVEADDLIATDPSGSIMIPRWLLRAKAGQDVAYGDVLVYAVLLSFAAGRLLDDASYCNAMAADVARRVGFTSSYVRRAFHDLERCGLIERDGDFTRFRAHACMGGGIRPDEVRFLDVQHRWANEADFLPKTIARIPFRTLGSGEKIFYAVLRRFEKRRWKMIAAKQATLGQELGIGERMVQKYVAKLEAKGLIDVEDRRRYRRASVMHTHVREPFAGKTRQAARAESQKRRASREDG